MEKGRGSQKKSLDEDCESPKSSSIASTPYIELCKLLERLSVGLPDFVSVGRHPALSRPNWAASRFHIVLQQHARNRVVQRPAGESTPIESGPLTVLDFPPEIIIEIFQHYVPAYPTRPERLGDGSPLISTRVCRLWRNIMTLPAFGAPSRCDSLRPHANKERLHPRSGIRGTYTNLLSTRSFGQLSRLKLVEVCPDQAWAILERTPQVVECYFCFSPAAGGWLAEQPNNPRKPVVFPRMSTLALDANSIRFDLIHFLGGLALPALKNVAISRSLLMAQRRSHSTTLSTPMARARASIRLRGGAARQENRWLRSRSLIVDRLGLGMGGRALGMKPSGFFRRWRRWSFWMEITKGQLRVEVVRLSS
uniref:F-box domain-containing protein n=1 Tax=Mycena chlorophos TaxID=658473 RepID=A0ABQ0LIM9_MYCCL|nr:predicted protein [Mycena chlorophos]